MDKAVRDLVEQAIIFIGRLFKYRGWITPENPHFIFRVAEVMDRELGAELFID